MAVLNAIVGVLGGVVIRARDQFGQSPTTSRAYVLKRPDQVWDV